MRPVELLIPASSLEVLKIAVIYGADAVYIGGEVFGLRAKAKNFSMEDMAEGIQFAHEHGVKVYVTANILAHNGDLEGVREYFTQLKEIKPDALIISDPGIYTIAKEICPEIERHISTQANNTNYGTYQFWWNQGAKRVVTARELSLKEIAEIRKNIPDEMEIETFVHGAMCISYSGRCLLSNFLVGRDANQGSCTHPCRWKYSIVEESRPGEHMPVYENERGTYIFNSKDLCMIEHMDDILTSGIDSLKIEGRMKTALYVATVARTYRKAIDDCKESVEKYRANIKSPIIPSWIRSSSSPPARKKLLASFLTISLYLSNRHSIASSLPLWICLSNFSSEIVFNSFILYFPSRCLTTSNARTPAATEAFSESISPFIGIDEIKSHFSFTKRLTPLPSLFCKPYFPNMLF